MLTNLMTRRRGLPQRLAGQDDTASAAGRGPVLRGVAVAALLCAAGAVQAQTFFVEPSVSAALTVTNNGDFQSRGDKRSDTIVDVGAGLSIRGRGARTRVDGRFALNSINYLNNTRSDSVTPNGSIDLNSELVDNWFFIDAGIQAQQTSQNVLSARPEGSSSFNRITNTTYRVAPYVERDLSPTLHLRARTDQSWTESGGQGASRDNNAHVQRHQFLLNDKPHPLGWSAELTRDDTRYEGQDESALVEDAARVTASYLWDQQFQIGVVLGHEKLTTLLEKDSSTIYGLDAAWRPDARTDVHARVEKRSFGTGWEGGFTHRTPSYAWNIAFSRRPTTYAQALGSVGRGGNIYNLLDAMLTTRFPDPVARAKLVNDLIAGQGLPASLAEPLSIIGSGAQLTRSVVASLVFTGARNTLSFSAFTEDVEALDLADVALVLPRDTTSQRGFAVEFNRRLTQQTSLALTARWARTETQNLVREDNARDVMVGASVTTALSPTTTASAGVRRQIVKSTLSGNASETALVAGLNHRF